MTTDHPDLLDRSLRCSEVVDLVTHLLDDALSDHDRRLVESHLASCEGCPVYIAQIRTTITVTARVAATAMRSTGIHTDLLLQELAKRRQRLV